MATTSVWTTLFIQSNRENERFSLVGKRIQLRADATRFNLWVHPEVPADRDDSHEREVILHGARITGLSDDDVRYEGYLDESESPFGKADGTQTMRKVEIILAVEPLDLIDPATGQSA
jgi:hypothetical protein